MRTQKLTVGLAATLALALSSPALADSAPKEEQIGVGTGLVVGALAGGPVGALLGAAAGARLGDSLHDKRIERDTLAGQLDAERQSVTRLQARVDVLQDDNATLGREVDSLSRVARPEFLSLLRAGIEMDLLFRTDEHALAADTSARLSSLATTLASIEDVQVRIEGYSDERGDAGYNLKLSERRALAVRDVLVSAGMPQDRIQVLAKGESPVSEATADNFALERKVNLTVFLTESPAIAAAP